MSRKFFTGIDVQNQQIINVTSPTLATDAANKQYVDNVVNGLVWKSAVDVATTAPGMMASSFAAGQVVDGYTLKVGNRILVKNQTNSAQDGIYVVQASGAPVLAPDSGTGDLLTNSTVRVNNGTTQADTGWTLMTAGVITVGSTNQSWVQTGTSAPYTAGVGLTLNGVTFSVQQGLGIVAGSSTGVSIDTTIVARKYSALIGDGTSTSYVISHNLSNRAVITSIFDSSSYEVVDADITNTSANAVTVGFASPPTTNQFTVVIVG